MKIQFGRVPPLEYNPCYGQLIVDRMDKRLGIDIQEEIHSIAVQVVKSLESSVRRIEILAYNFELGRNLGLDVGLNLLVIQAHRDGVATAAHSLH